MEKTTMLQYLVFICMLIVEYYPSVLSLEPLRTRILLPGHVYIYKHSDDVYNQLIDLKDFKFLINPPRCNHSLLLLVIVTTKWNHYERRKWIRETWTAPWEWTRVLFFVGEPNSFKASDFQKIRNESDLYGDIVMGNFVDAYVNMTYKHTMGLKWVAHHCPNAKYILKLDDDVAVDPEEFREFLVQRLSPWGARRLIACNCYADESFKSKYKPIVMDYCGTFCHGWAILYSQDAVHELLRVVQRMPYHWIDDIHITKTCADVLEIPRIPLCQLERRWRQLFKTNTLYFYEKWLRNHNEAWLFRLLH
ncbi:beta-1,3-galactosyltransferase 5-like [Plodia interpunctella]|uniref:beta-1,3-galactosyltransferase 5-like n=1 Tax=Plodia interpunctella TaxID=58824 RepID=UPI002368D0CD|nr:beta-1,3-galactosyltransferase 5-like [Plodia interpunctella]